MSKIKLGADNLKAYLGHTKLKAYLGDTLLTGGTYSGELPVTVDSIDTSLTDYVIHGSVNGLGTNQLNVYDYTLQQGSLKAADGTELSSNSRVRTDWGDIKTAGTYTVNCQGRAKVAVIYVYDENKQFIAAESLTSWDNMPRSITITAPRYIRLVVAKTSSQTDHIYIPDVTTLTFTKTLSDYTIPIISRTINYFNAVIEQGTFMASNGAELSSNYRVRGTVGEILPAGTYKINCVGALGGTAYIYDSTGAFVSADVPPNWGELPITITIHQPSFVRPVFAAQADGAEIAISPSDVSNVIIAPADDYDNSYVQYQKTETVIYIGSSQLTDPEYLDYSENTIYKLVDNVLTPVTAVPALPAIPVYNDKLTVLESSLVFNTELEWEV